MRRPTLSVCILSLALCVSGGFQQGYIASVLNPPYVYIESFINETVTERFGVVMSDDLLSTVWSFLNVMFPIASIVGQFLAAWMCRRFGRKGTAIISSLLYLPGTILSSLSYPVRSFEMLFIGRFLWSLGNGINAVNTTVWIVECAPTEIRGTMGSMQEFSMAIGSLFVQTIGIPFNSATLWPWIFVPDVPLVIFSIVLFLFVPDSPVSILEREQDIDKASYCCFRHWARSVLARYYGISVDAPEINRELNLERKRTEDKEREERPGILWIFNPFGQKEDRVRVIQQAAWLGVIVKIAYVFTGARALRAYSTFFLYDMAHFTLQGANLGSWIVAILRIPFGLIPVLFVDRLGRRLLMNVSMVITVVALAAIMVGILVGDSLQASDSSILILAACSFGAVMLVNAAGLGRAVTKIAVEFAWFPVANMIGVYSMLMFLVPSLAFLVVIWLMCPETSNRTVFEVLEDIARRKKLKVSFTH